LPPNKSGSEITKTVTVTHLFTVNSESRNNSELEEGEKNNSTHFPIVIPNNTALDSITTFVFASKKVNRKDCDKSMLNARVAFHITP
jgi:hypothetical protein